MSEWSPSDTLGAYLIAVLAMAAGGCNNSSFAGGGSTPAGQRDQTAEADAVPDRDAELGTPGDAEPDPEDRTPFEVPDDCTPDGVTQAKLLTQKIKNDTPGQFIEYQIFVTDCEGKIKNVTSDSVLFDVNAQTDGGVSAIRFEVQTPKRKLVTQGVMDTVQGRDLFGKISPAFFFYQTDKRIEFSVPSKSFLFRVEPGAGHETAMQNVGDPAKEAGDQEVETFLRFGKAKPVRKVVLFVNP